MKPQYICWCIRTWENCSKKHISPKLDVKYPFSVNNVNEYTYKMIQDKNTKCKSFIRLIQTDSKK